jgi:predicted phosphodiesterase
VATLAVISDLHGNIPALEAVLADLEQVRPDQVVIAGDFVNRGPQSRAVLERIVPLGFPAISGNHDTWLAALARGRNRPDGWDTSQWTPVRLAAEELSTEWATWLEELPRTLRIEMPGAAPVRVVHGSPRYQREGLGRLCSDEQAREALEGVSEPLVIGAHIHYPYERFVGGQHIVVTGAVGCPFNGDENAQYGLFTWDGARWHFTHRSVPYDHEPLYAAWRESGYLDDGSISSELMLMEHQTARSHYAPFMLWCNERGIEMNWQHYAVFAAERAPFMPPPVRAAS